MCAKRGHIHAPVRRRWPFLGAVGVSPGKWVGRGSWAWDASGSWNSGAGCGEMGEAGDLGWGRVGAGGVSWAGVSVCLICTPVTSRPRISASSTFRRDASAPLEWRFLGRVTPPDYRPAVVTSRSGRWVGGFCAGTSGRVWVTAESEPKRRSGFRVFNRRGHSCLSCGDRRCQLPT